MHWTNRRHLFDPHDGPDWLKSHAMLPVPYHRSDDVYRIYFAGRDDRNMSQIGYVDVDLTSPDTPLGVSGQPVLRSGELGLFDDSGVFPSSVIEIDGTVYLYYVGWMRTERVRYLGACGLASSNDGGDSFERISKAPVLPRTKEDPYMSLSACITRSDGIFRMWYTSTKKWKEIGDETVPLCQIKYAESNDGIAWTRTGTISIPLRPDETRIAGPTVRDVDDGLQMWYCHARGLEGYRIGYAESSNGKHWERQDDQAGIDIASEGWDSEMLAYPSVFDHKGETYLLYNGNGYGESGFGLAVLED